MLLSVKMIYIILVDCFKYYIESIEFPPSYLCIWVLPLTILVCLSNILPFLLVYKLVMPCIIIIFSWNFGILDHFAQKGYYPLSSNNPYERLQILKVFPSFFLDCGAMAKCLEEVFSIFRQGFLLFLLPIAWMQLT